MSYRLHRPGENLTGNIEFFTALTLVDISDTGISDPAGGTPYEQAQNLNSLLQCIGLRSQPIMTSVESLEDQDMADFSFGTDHTGTNNVWVLKFATEHLGAVTISNLQSDVEGLPVYTGLNDTASLPSGVFQYSSTSARNIYFVENDNL